MKRFYKVAKVTAADDEFGVQLDGKPLLTPGKRALRVPSRALAEAIAAEWQGQGVTVKPLELPLTRLVSTALDRVEPRNADVIGEIASC
jgi:chaperone required for assembly of F1-ATPase